MVLPFTPEAESVIEEFARDIQERGEQASGIYAGTLGKARGHALRLACVVEHLWWCATAGAEPTTISAEAATAAAALVDSYFVPMAERTFGDAAIPVAERGAMVLARHIRRERLAQFNARDVRRTVGGSLREPAAMDAACAELMEAGLIRPLPSEAVGPGRKPKNFEVHPIVARRAA